MKYNKTKYLNIYTYETKKGKRYYVRRNFKLNGKKKEATASNLKTLAEARHALAEIENKIANNEYDPKKNMTVNDYWEIYSENRIKTGRWAPDTIRNKNNLFKVHFEKRYGQTRLVDINRQEYEVFIAKMLKKYSRTTVVQTSAILEAMLTDAEVNGYIDKNLILKIYVGDSSINQRDKRLSVEKFQNWDRCAKKVLSTYDYTMVRLTYFGLRVSEVLGIKFSSLKLVDGRYRIFLNESRTKGRPSGGKMKTKQSERYVFVDKETTALLDLAIKETKRIAKKAGIILNKESFLFIDDGSKCKRLFGKPVVYTRISVIFQKVSKAIGIHVSPHMMRHFFATQGQIAGVPVEHMAAALGHSTSYMTQKYTHIQDEVASEVTDSFLRAIK